MMMEATKYKMEYSPSHESSSRVERDEQPFSRDSVRLASESSSAMN